MWSRDQPIRVCPTPWCSCPHRETGPDDRCKACRERPANVEIHGFTWTRIYGECWMGEWGGSFLTYGIEDPAERERHRADNKECVRIAHGLNKKELAAWLNYARIVPYAMHFDVETRDGLRSSAILRQMALWWPRSFVRSTAAMLERQADCRLHGGIPLTCMGEEL